VSTLNKNIRDSISDQIGIPFEKIVEMDFSEIDRHIEKGMGGKKLIYSFQKNPHVIGRGNRNIAERRYHFFVK